MALISIRESHNVGAQEAQRRLDEYVNELTSGTFPGVTIDDVQKQWDGSRLETSFRAKKGFFSKRVTGSMQVEESSVNLEVEVPDLVFSFVPRQEVEGAVRQKLRENFPSHPWTSPLPESGEDGGNVPGGRTRYRLTACSANFAPRS